MKYLVIVALLLFAGQSIPTAQAATDTAKSGKGMMMHDGMHNGDSCKDCKDGHGGAMMGHDGMGHDGMGHDGMGHGGGMMCREGGMDHEGGMMGKGGMECCGGASCGMMGGGMHRGGVIGMVIHGLFALLGLIALVLLIMIEMHWVRLLSNRVKATKVVAVTTKE